MREIEFRAWDGSQMIYDIGVVNGKACDFDGESVWFWHEQPQSIMQFTGLTDKNKVKIFESDIVLAQTAFDGVYDGEYQEYVVGFENGTFVLKRDNEAVRQWNDGNNEWFSIENADRKEIISNLYER